METEQITESLTKRNLGILAVGVLVGASVFMLAEQVSGPGADQVGQQLVSTLEMQSGNDLELVQATTENGMYKIQVKNGQDQLSTYYTSRDGDILIEEAGTTEFDTFRRTIEAQTNFTECLERNDVVMYGNASQQETVAQVRLLGGTNNVEPIYRSVNTRENLREAINSGIRRIPGFTNGNQTVQGIQTYENLEEFSGCSYSMN